METVSFFLAIIGTALTILGIILTVINSKQLNKGIKISALLEIRKLINRMERQKQNFDANSIQWTTLDATQDDLETLFKSIKTTFAISDNEAPLN